MYFRYDNTGKQVIGRKTLAFLAGLVVKPKQTSSRYHDITVDMVALVLVSVY